MANGYVVYMSLTYTNMNALARSGYQNREQRNAPRECVSLFSGQDAIIFT